MNFLNNELAGFTGTESYYKYSSIFPDYYITDGVKYAADSYGLYWFLDIICSYQGEEKFKCEPFQVWTLKRTGNNSFVVIADDGNKNKHQSQRIQFSDFTKDHFKVYLIDNIILLPSEN